MRGAVNTILITCTTVNINTDETDEAMVLSMKCSAWQQVQGRPTRVNDAHPESSDENSELEDS